MANLKGGRQPKLLGSSLQRTLDRLRKKHGVCGASLAILKDGHVYSVASGWANAAEKIEATPQTLFQIGSISKTFTATLAMQLVDEGLLDLDATVRHYLPDFATADPVTQKLTVRQLLTHTSGMEGDFFPPDAETGGTSAGYVRMMRGLHQLHAPGEYMTYCNSGYVVLPRIVEVLRKSSWNDLVLERICKPLGMARVIAHPAESLRFRMAMGHDAICGRTWQLSATSYLPLSLAGCGSVLSMSASDLLLYAKAHMQGPVRKAGKQSILSQASFKAMQAPQVEMPAHSRRGYSHMGLGWFLQPDDKFPKFNHDGATSQFAFLHALPKQKLAFALLINSPSQVFPEELRKAIFNEIGGLPKEPQAVVPAAGQSDKQRCVGRYVGPLQDMSVTAASHEDLQLSIALNGVAKPIRLKLRPAGPDSFAILDKPYVDQGDKVVFLGDQVGRAKYIRFGVRMMKRAD